MKFPMISSRLNWSKCFYIAIYICWNSVHLFHTPSFLKKVLQIYIYICVNHTLYYYDRARIISVCHTHYPW